MTKEEAEKGFFLGVFELGGRHGKTGIGCDGCSAV